MEKLLREKIWRLKDRIKCGILGLFHSRLDELSVVHFTIAAFRQKTRKVWWINNYENWFRKITILRSFSCVWTKRTRRKCNFVFLAIPQQNQKRRLECKHRKAVKRRATSQSRWVLKTADFTKLSKQTHDSCVHKWTHMSASSFSIAINYIFKNSLLTLTSKIRKNNKVKRKNRIFFLLQCMWLGLVTLLVCWFWEQVLKLEKSSNKRFNPVTEAS